MAAFNLCRQGAPPRKAAAKSPAPPASAQPRRLQLQAGLRARFTRFTFVTIRRLDLARRATAFARIFRAGLDKPARSRQKISLHGPENRDAPYHKKGL